MDGIDWCSRQISQLSVEELKIPSLNEIKNYFSNVPPQEAVRTAHSLELSLVFNCLDDPNSEQVDLACEVLTVCMQNLSIGEATNRYSSPLERALNHSFSSVKIMALNEIQRNMEDEQVVINFSKQLQMLASVIRCMADNDLSVAKHASAVIREIAKSSEGTKQLLGSDGLAIIKETMSSNEVVKLRFNEAFINISKSSEKFMNTFIATGLMDLMFQDLNSDDVLLKLNIIELFSQLVTTKHGYEYLDSQNLIISVFSILDTDDVLTYQLCEPGIFKFFGHMGHFEPVAALTKYPEILQKIYENVEYLLSPVSGVALDVLGHIAETKEGKIALNRLSPQFPTALKEVFSKLGVLPTDVRIRALNCLQSAFELTEFDSKVTNIIRKWYEQLDQDDPMIVFYKIAQNPFLEIRSAGLGVLRAMATHNWGQERFRNTPGFVEYLLDRNGENFKECKEIKYEIVNILSVSQVFDETSVARFKKFVREGPFYKESTLEVAIEGED